MTIKPFRRMRKLTTLLWVMLTIFASNCFASKSLEFSVPTTDGKAVLTGEIDLPEPSKDQLSLVVMIPGTGLFDRNVLFGHSNTDRDFIFKDLSNALLTAGVASLRFDYRGVHCNSRVTPHRNDCVDKSVRQQVTPENIRADIKQLYDYALHFPGIDPSKVSVFAHSEGTIHVSRLIGSKQINPKSVTFMGMVAESPKGIIHWQMVNRQVENMFEADKNHDGILTNEEIQEACNESNIIQDICDKFKFPSGSETRDAFTAPYEEAYQKAYQDALATPENQPYPHATKPGDRAQASYRWWKMWFTDDRNDVDDLVGYTGKLFVHNGDIDSQTPGVREFSFIENAKGYFTSLPIFTLHTGKGHGLSDDPLFGPLDPTIEKQIVDEISSAMK